MPGSKTSVYLTDELAARIRGQPRSMAQLLTDALDAGPPGRPATRREMRADVRRELAPVLEVLRAILERQSGNGQP